MALNLDRLPPLNALRAFEAAARYQNFSRAAEELHVTQGAVSRQIKVLEDYLGLTLFHRLPQGLELTETGKVLLPDVSESFQILTRITRKVALQDESIKVLAAPTIGTRWLVPRLRQFKETHPNLNVSAGLFHSSYEEFFKGSYDCGIDCSETGGTRPGNFTATLLRREKLTPVCSPDLLKQVPLSELADLRSHTLLHSHPVEPYDWRKWLEAVGFSDVDINSGLRFDTLEMAVQAAVSGLGVAVADILLIRNELDTGQLVTPFNVVVSDDTGYYFFWPDDRTDDPKIAAFRDWLLQEAKEKD